MFSITVGCCFTEILMDSDSGLRCLFASAVHDPNHQLNSSDIRFDHGKRPLMLR